MENRTNRDPGKENKGKSSCELPERPTAVSGLACPALARNLQAWGHGLLAAEDGHS